MHVLVSGSSGLIGSALLPVLSGRGHTIRRLVRRSPRPGEARWSPDEDFIDAHAFDGIDAVVHLAGETIAALRWTAAKKQGIRDSRVRGTALLARAIPKLREKPAVVVSASGVGFYGDRGDEILDETSASGHGFLADVCRQWEAAARPVADAGVRLITIRTGVVLSRSGGALASMLRPFRLGAGGVLGTGRQYMSWIAIDDEVGAIAHLLATPTASGPVNLVAPNAVTNTEFTKTLGRILRRPTVFRIPAFALRLTLGEMADEMLLGGTRAAPACLTASGYRFGYPALDAALRHVLRAAA